MNIAFLTPEYPHPKTGVSGGIGTSIRALAQALIKLNHGVIILLYGQKQDGSFEDEGVIVECIKNVKVKGLSWWLTRKKLERIINTHHANATIDLVEAPDWTGITSFINPKSCPIIIRMNGSDTYFCHLENRPSKWINRFHERRALKMAAGVISVSHFTGQKTKKIFNLSFNYDVIYNGIDIEKFTSKNIKKEESRILYFGTLIRKKGVLELPHIFNKLRQLNPKVKLILVGNDSFDILTGSSSTWALMKTLFDFKPLNNVEYLGPMSHEFLREEIKKASVCIFPSFAEACPLSWLEAMAMEKAIVASNIGWANELIIDKNCGYLVHPKNHDVFAEKINDLLNNSNLSIEFGVNARILSLNKFSSMVIAKDTLSVYEKILKS